MARMKYSVNPKTIFDKYTLKQLYDKIKNYNIPNYTKMKKSELTQYLDTKFSLQNEMLILKSQSQINIPQQNNQDYFDFSPDLFSDFSESQNPLLQSIDLPVALKRPPPATKGNRKQYPVVHNRKIMPPKPRGRPKKNI